MKKSFLALTLLLAVSGASIFATPGPVTDPRAESNFKKQFAGASHVQWSTTNEGYIQATFTWANQRTIAFYSPNAEFLGSVRNLFFAQLPLTVMKSIESQFGSDSVIEINEITNDEGTQYSVTFDQNDKRYKARISSLGEVLQKERLKK